MLHCCTVLGNGIYPEKKTNRSSSLTNTWYHLRYLLAKITCTMSFCTQRSLYCYRSKYFSNRKAMTTTNLISVVLQLSTQRNVSWYLLRLLDLTKELRLKQRLHTCRYYNLYIIYVLYISAWHILRKNKLTSKDSMRLK